MLHPTCPFLMRTSYLVRHKNSCSRNTPHRWMGHFSGRPPSPLRRGCLFKCGMRVETLIFCVVHGQTTCPPMLRTFLHRWCFVMDSIASYSPP